MSSILDALKKLEDEKAARKAAELGESHVFEAHRAESDLLGDRGMASLQNPWLLLGGIVLAVVVGLSASLAWTILQTEPAPVNATIIAPVARPEPVMVTPPVSEVPDPIATALNNLEIVEPGSPAAAPTPELPTTEVKPALTDILQPVEPEPALTPPQPRAPVLVASAAPVPAAVVQPALIVEPTPKITPPPPPRVEKSEPQVKRNWPTDFTRWPMMLSADRSRYGLENIKLNVLRAATKTRRHALAVINLDKVFVGDIIPKSKGVRLMGVSSKGIGIEITSNGESLEWRCV